MRSLTVLLGLVVSGTMLLANLPAAAEESTATPVAEANESVGLTNVSTAQASLAEFVAEIKLGVDASSAAAGMAVDANGTLYVIDSFKEHILVYDRDGNLVAIIGESGDMPGQFGFHERAGGFWGDVALGADGNLYVADPMNSRVQVLAPDGSFLHEWGEPGSGEGQFATDGHGRGLKGIATDAEGRVFVTDGSNGRVQIFSANGEALDVWTGEGAAGGPLVNPADAVVDAFGTISVTDLDAGRIVQFDAEGNVSNVIGETGDQPGQFDEPWGIAADGEGNLFVADYYNHRVQVFSRQGDLLGTIGAFGVQPGQFNGPIYVEATPDGFLYVADEGNHRVQIFRLLSLPAEGSATPAP